MGARKLPGDELASLASDKCAKFAKALKERHVDIESTGHKDTNALVNLLKCETKALQVCSRHLAAYEACHKSVMGTGGYQGKKHCGEELKSLLSCVTEARTP
jgi:hypothetical protein